MFVFVLFTTSLAVTMDVTERANDFVAQAEIVSILRPNPKLGPSDVVRVQLYALCENKKDNRGIAHCFEFASPENREYTGPVEEFVRMVRSYPYAMLLNHRLAIVGSADTREDRASVLVTLIDRQGRLQAYSFVLSMQTSGAEKNCWMTDGVTHIPLEPKVQRPRQPALMARPAVSK